MYLKDDNVTYAVEELVAMLLANTKSLAEDHAGAKAKDCVITVPQYFTQFERQALLDAANIAGLHVLSLIDENTAAALKYSIDQFTEGVNGTQNVLFYNMGARSAQVSIYQFTAMVMPDKLVGGKNKTITHLRTLSKTWDTATGGSYLDAVLVEEFSKIREKNAGAPRERGGLMVAAAID